VIFPALSTMMEKVNDFNPDLLIDFDDVSFIRGGRNLVGPLTWKVELDERWVVLGPNGAGKTTLMRLAGAEEFPSSGIAHIMGEQLGKTDMRDLRTMIGMSSSALANRIPTEEQVSDLVVSAGYAILGRWREEYNDMDFGHADAVLEQVGGLPLKERLWGRGRGEERGGVRHGHRLGHTARGPLGTVLRVGGEGGEDGAAARAAPAKGDPPPRPFCLHGFFPPPLTKALVLV